MADTTAGSRATGKSNETVRDLRAQRPRTHWGDPAGRWGQTESATSTYIPLGAAPPPLFGKHANASVRWPGNGGPERFLWKRATMEPFGTLQNTAFSRPR
jgi:hypothetical protein